jgi:hypothetical protein
MTWISLDMVSSAGFGLLRWLGGAAKRTQGGFCRVERMVRCTNQFVRATGGKFRTQGQAEADGDPQRVRR